ncbi:hypothetical protein VOLCADRAFT_98509 [Volvox carteri f. nagariensis]|uniref:DUF6817 domain-containing protein n=1 Tax=Volvox carteri f. nagariensis TaxID=3068 RepID=D8UFI9_VOLCA|nr:uncharacterized protein VOLCADRAFT_98509 [Volvox carteri f. nagariensis]EFJ41512.1 hypothetical protein VOLCADRAFT_98509 [Volvox carteri f. nagariensis]|eukprot:XP_002957457.1 hypothetical protein VOLCADRAFT_98509 [Volvox carteri f. nagariensis]
MTEADGSPKCEAGSGSEADPDIAWPKIPGIVRAFLRGDLSRIDPHLPEWLDVLSSVGAGECWHKNFKSHLYEVYKICKIWGQDDDVCKCALFHSAYSNSYVNLAIFKESTDRTRLRELVGHSAEDLIHTFCVVPRHNLVYDDLLARAPSAEDLAALGVGGAGGDDGAAAAAAPPSLRRLVPPEGITVRHIKTGEPLTVDRLTVARFLVMTMADFCEQLFSWQDSMFENHNGRLLYAGTNHGSLWPGACKPGLWHSALSRMGALLRFACTGPEGRPLVPLPPVFEGCTQVITEADQLAARDAYWVAVSECTETHKHDEALRLLRTACWHNPHVAEPHVLLAQIYCQRGQWVDGRRHADRAVRLLGCWGTAWDKRMSWEAWMAMARVLAHGAARGTWPTTPFGMLNLGLVPDLDEPYDVTEDEQDSGKD